MNDFDQLSEEELARINSETSRILQAKRDNRKQSALDELNRVCTENQLTVADVKLFLKSFGKPTANEGDKPLPLYVNPKNSLETWDGTNRPPRFIRAALKSGLTLESLIKTDNTNAG